LVLAGGGQKKSNTSASSVKKDPAYNIQDKNDAESFAKKTGEVIGKIKKSELSKKVVNQVEEFKKLYEEANREKK
jgi:hypothetical protein